MVTVRFPFRTFILFYHVLETMLMRKQWVKQVEPPGLFVLKRRRPQEIIMFQVKTAHRDHMLKIYHWLHVELQCTHMHTHTLAPSHPLSGWQPNSQLSMHDQYRSFGELADFHANIRADDSEYAAVSLHWLHISLLTPARASPAVCLTLTHTHTLRTDICLRSLIKFLSVFSNQVLFDGMFLCKDMTN